jgi:SAM-dependent methyltransferase
MSAKSGFHDHHDWHSKEYVRRWADRQDERLPHRSEAFQVMAKTIPFPKTASLRILDVGAGYGGLTRFLLEYFPAATAVCQDTSKEMAELGKERMKHLAGRFTYVLSDLNQRNWTAKIDGPFDAVVSSIAIHNVRDPEIIHRIFKDIFPLVKPGGCFLDIDRVLPSKEELFEWLEEAGFEKVGLFWQSGHRALFGGFKKVGKRLTAKGTKETKHEQFASSWPPVNKGRI